MCACAAPRLRSWLCVYGRRAGGDGAGRSSGAGSQGPSTARARAAPHLGRLNWQPRLRVGQKVVQHRPVGGELRVALRRRLVVRQVPYVVLVVVQRQVLKPAPCLISTQYLSRTAYR